MKKQDKPVVFHKHSLFLQTQGLIFLNYNFYQLLLELNCHFLFHIA